MKLLFDQNISFRIIKKISHLYKDADQVRRLNLENLTDSEIWKYAKKHEYAIVSFDSDFYDISNLKGHPPKIIWLRTGNTSTKNLIKILIEKYETIDDFLHNPENKNLACLEIE